MANKNITQLTPQVGSADPTSLLYAIKGIPGSQSDTSLPLSVLFTSPTFTGTPTIPFTQSGTGAVPQTVTSALRRIISVTDFGADPTGTNDSTAAIQNAVNAQTSGGTVLVPAGTYKYTSLTIPAGVLLQGTTSYASTLLRTLTTGTGITLNTSAGLNLLQITASAPATSGVSILTNSNGNFITNCAIGNYYIGVQVTNSGVGVVIQNNRFFSPSITVGGALILGTSYANLVIDNVIASGPASGTQPSQGISLINGDTCIISDVNITLHGAALSLSPPTSNNIFATTVSNSLFDSAGGHSCCEMVGVGGVYSTKFTNCWFGLANTGNSGCLINPTGAVDGVSFSGCEFVGNGDSGLRVNSTNAVNITVIGGWASGNTYGLNFSGGVSHFNVIGVNARPGEFRGANSQYGITIQAGASDYFQLIGNDLQGNTVGALSNAATGTNFTVVGNGGVSPATIPGTIALGTVSASGTISPSQTAGIVGTTTNNNANAGSVGEYVTNTTSGTSLTTATAANATSISLTAGDWDVSGVVQFVPAGTTTLQAELAGISTTSATFGGLGTLYNTPIAYGAGGGNITPPPTPTVRLSLSATTTVYLVAQATFAVSTLTCNGLIRARRVR